MFALCRDDEPFLSISDFFGLDGGGPINSRGPIGMNFFFEYLLFFQGLFFPLFLILIYTFSLTFGFFFTDGGFYA